MKYIRGMDSGRRFSVSESDALQILFGAEKTRSSQLFDSCSNDKFSRTRTNKPRRPNSFQTASRPVSPMHFRTTDELEEEEDKSSLASFSSHYESKMSSPPLPHRRAGVIMGVRALGCPQHKNMCVLSCPSRGSYPKMKEYEPPKLMLELKPNLLERESSSRTTDSIIKDMPTLEKEEQKDKAEFSKYASVKLRERAEVPHLLNLQDDEQTPKDVYPSQQSYRRHSMFNFKLPFLSAKKTSTSESLPEWGSDAQFKTDKCQKSKKKDKYVPKVKLQLIDDNRKKCVQTSQVQGFISTLPLKETRQLLDCRFTLREENSRPPYAQRLTMASSPLISSRQNHSKVLFDDDYKLRELPDIILPRLEISRETMVSPEPRHKVLLAPKKRKAEPLSAINNCFDMSALDFDLFVLDAPNSFSRKRRVNRHIDFEAM